MRAFDYVMVTIVGLVFLEACVIITFNTKREFWERINKIHALCLVLYPIYLSSVIYASLECTRSTSHCDYSWKICCTLYIILTMAVYTFYYVKSNVVHTIDWNGKRLAGRFSLLGIAMMGLMGMAFFWLPVEGFQYNAFLSNGECELVERAWIPIVWMIGDTALSILLLMLFIRPLQEIQELLGDSPKSVAMLLGMKRMTEKNRNLLVVIVLATLIVMIRVSVGNINMRTVHYLCSMDRLVTIQCITLTFSYDGVEYFYCIKPLSSLCNIGSDTEDEDSSSLSLMPPERTRPSQSIIVIGPLDKSRSTTDRRESSSIRPVHFGAVG